MESAASMHDAARRLEEAAAIFRLKSRGALEEYGDLTAQWDDSRARQFALQHIEPQREWIEQGARLCQLHGASVDMARGSADEAERSISSFFSAQSAFESAADSSRQTANAARDEAAGSAADSTRAGAEVQSIRASVAAASVDPGW
jgi:DNA-binding SARP family transcriptional activator